MRSELREMFNFVEVFWGLVFFLVFGLVVVIFVNKE